MAHLPLRLSGAARLALGDSLPFELPGDAEERGFVLHHPEGYFAFVNRCPHWSVDLDLGMGGFYDPALDRVFCRNHGALFALPSGRCDHGPCIGRALERLTVHREGDDLIIERERR